jgi:hypothetical protein
VTSKTVDVHVAALRLKRGDTLKISPDLVPRLDWGEVTLA